MHGQSVLLNAAAINRVLMRIAHEISERHENSQAMALIGIQRGGVHLAHRLGGQLQAIWGHSVPGGSLDVSMHRDDLGRQAAPKVHPTVIPFDVTDKTLVPVLYTLFRGPPIPHAM